MILLTRKAPRFSDMGLPEPSLRPSLRLLLCPTAEDIATGWKYGFDREVGLVGNAARRPLTWKAAAAGSLRRAFLVRRAAHEAPHYLHVFNVGQSRRQRWGSVLSTESLLAPEARGKGAGDKHESSRHQRHLFRSKNNSHANAPSYNLEPAVGQALRPSWSYIDLAPSIFLHPHHGVGGQLRLRRNSQQRTE